MGLFSRSNKPNGPAGRSSSQSRVPKSRASPSLASVFQFAQAPEVPEPVVPVRESWKFKVVVDPLPLEHGTFTIDVDPEDTSDAIRQAVMAHLDLASVSIFKVRIPSAAVNQAREYRTRYRQPANLLGPFPCFNLDDPRHVSCDWDTCAPQTVASPTIRDWFPEHRETETFSILVKSAVGSSSSALPPLSILMHFAPSESRRSSSAPSQCKTQRAPLPLSISQDATVAQLKCAILQADGRQPYDESGSLKSEAAKVVLWKVEMSKEEMVVIGERGGLKRGRMPWPYPPNSPVPVAVNDDQRLVRDYFSAEYDFVSVMVQLSVWLPASFDDTMPRASLSDAPVFKYPMDFTVLDQAKPPAFGVRSSSDPIVRSSRQRPSTAPVTSSRTGGSDPAPAFGHASRSGSLTPNFGESTRQRAISPLATSVTVPTGLGISLSNPSSPINGTRNRGSLSPSLAESATSSSSSSSSSNSSTGESSVPSLTFSELNLSAFSSEAEDIVSPLPTPEVERHEWLGSSKMGSKASHSSDAITTHAMVTELGETKRTNSLKVMSLGSMGWRRGGKVGL